MRLFEATGAGACLITDRKENLGTLFVPDGEVVAYTSPEDCIEKVLWLLDHPEERNRIAKAGQARTLREHTFIHRAEEFDDLVASALGGRINAV
jgi:spore maturation protein CgeB